MEILLLELPIFRSNVGVKTKGTVYWQTFKQREEDRMVFHVFTGKNSGVVTQTYIQV